MPLAAQYGFTPVSTQIDQVLAAMEVIGSDGAVSLYDATK